MIARTEIAKIAGLDNIYMACKFFHPECDPRPISSTNNFTRILAELYFNNSIPLVSHKAFSEMPYFQPKLVLPSSLSFNDKTILITGASAGLGLAATQLLLRLGAREIIAGVRNISKAEAVKSNIFANPKTQRTNPNAKITILHVDFEDYESLLAFAHDVRRRYDGKLEWCFSMREWGVSNGSWQNLAMRRLFKSTSSRLL